MVPPYDFLKLITFLEKHEKFHMVPPCHISIRQVKSSTFILIFINYNIHVSSQDVTKSQNVRRNHMRTSLFLQKITRGNHMKIFIFSKTI